MLFVEQISKNIENNSTQFISVQGNEHKTIKIEGKAMLKRALKIASILRQKQNLKRGDRVILCYMPGHEFMEAFLACMLSGLVAVPVCPPHPSKISLERPRLNAIITAAEAELVLTTVNYKRAFNLCNTTSMSSTDIKANVPWLCSDKLLLETEGESLSYIENGIQANDLALIQFTSGTTSHPKGVMISHQNITHNLDLLTAHANMSGSDAVITSWLPHFHDLGLMLNCIGFYWGCVVVQISALDFLQNPMLWLEVMSKFAATATAAPSSAIDMVNKHFAHQISVNENNFEFDLSSVCDFLVGGERVQMQTLLKFAENFQSYNFAKSCFHPCYGLAEHVLAVTGEIDNALLEFSSDESNQKYVACGRVDSESASAAAGVDVKIIDPNTLLPCPDGVEGEIWINSQSKAMGYWNDPTLSEFTFSASYQGQKSQDTYLRTGDLGFIATGHLVVTGRIKQLIIIRGKNYHPEDIEKTLLQKYDIFSSKSTAAFAIIEDGKSEKAGLVTELKNEQIRQLDATFIAEVSQQVCIEHGISVDEFQFLVVPAGTLPRTNTGKLQRMELNKLFQSNILSHHGTLISSVDTTGAV